MPSAGGIWGTNNRRTGAQCWDCTWATLEEFSGDVSYEVCGQASWKLLGC